MRAPGLTWFRLPLFIWAHHATGLIMILDTSYRHHHLPRRTRTRKRIFGYNYVAFSSAAITVFGLLV